MQKHYSAIVRAKNNLFRRGNIALSIPALLASNSAAANTLTSDPEIKLILAIGAMAIALVFVKALIKILNDNPGFVALMAFAGIGSGIINLLSAGAIPGINTAACLLAGVLLLFVSAFSYNGRR